MGVVHAHADIRHQRVGAGDVVILSGPIAAHGVAIMSLREGLEFETSVKSDTCSLKTLYWLCLIFWAKMFIFTGCYKRRPGIGTQ